MTISDIRRRGLVNKMNQATREARDLLTKAAEARERGHISATAIYIHYELPAQNCLLAARRFQEATEL